MSRPAVRTESLGKLYTLGERQDWYGTLRDRMGGVLASPLRALRGERDSSVGAATLWALRDVSFELQQGEVLGIIGRNGAGKSTLLKILSRITRPTAGWAQVRGRVGSLLEVGTGFHPELTGRENVFLNGAILGMPAEHIRRRFDEIVAFAELEQFLDTPVKRYSSGMYMRLAFSVAAHLEPDVLVVDEVLAVGDAAFQKKCLGKMEDVSREGRTVLFVSHNMPSVARLCDRALLLDRGRVVADGPAANVVGQYLHGSADGSAQRTWQDLQAAPGTSAMRLTSVGVFDRQARPVTVAPVSEPLTIEIGYRVARPGERFRCVVGLNTQGVCAFSTLEPLEAIHPEIGYYVSRVTVPGDFLAEGEYTLDVSIFASRGVKQHFVKTKSILAFQVVDPMTGTSARGDYAEGYAGVVRPKLSWEMLFRGAEPR